MKRIYLVVALLLSFVSQSFAQKDIELITFNRNPDTIRYSSANNGGPFVRYVFFWGFKNAGTVAFVQADTIKFRNWARGNTRNLILPPSGIAVGDTVYFSDTVGYLSGPAGSPANFNMCDSIWVKNGATVLTEPIANNRKCRTVYFRPDPLSVKDFDPAAPAITVFPNPAKGVLNLKYNFGSNSHASVKITDLLGRVVLNQELGKSLSGVQEFPLNISSLSAGLHMVELTINDKKQVAKIVIAK